MREISGVKNEVGLPVKSIDLIDRGLEGSVDIGIRRLIESDVAIADLHKREVLVSRLGSTQQAGRRHARSKAPYHSGSSPLHAVQEPAPVDVAIEEARWVFPVVFCLSHVERLSTAAAVV